MDTKTYSLQDLPTAAKEFLGSTGGAKVFALYGKMGAGKTTFIKAVCRELGAEDTVTSPTFAIVNEYSAGDGSPIYHFDFYRLKTKAEAVDMGCEEYFHSGSPCFIEWPEVVADLLPEGTVRVDISETMDGLREISVKPHGQA